jgi:hypothetical protein
MVLGKIFMCTGEEISRRMQKKHNEELRDLYPSNTDREINKGG